ncbi:hypothetical protein NLI96_g3625 [Meripilus lineatus]|uniref:Phosphodiesterase n=1 Tax=Meripilus lineatus TaxID=2056292 RepID=A0AAD5V646_9APHY|nr:hypothetical protein NLI96_g3625 [Physisporinus lineatus]
MEASSHVASTCVHVLGNPQTQRREKQPSLLRIILTRPPITSVLLLDALDNDELRAAATSASQNTARAYWEAASSSGSADAVTGTLPLGHIPHWVTDCEANYRVPYVDPHLPLSPAISSEIKAVIALEPASTTHPYDSQQYAEAIIDVRVHTEDIVNNESVDIVPPFTIAKEVRTKLIQSLGEWGFEPHKLPEEEVRACAYILFEALFRIEGLQDAVGVCLEQINGFLHQLQQIYRRNNTYHNFEHALDVYQATYYFLNVAEVVPPVSILLQPDARWRRQRGLKKNEFDGHPAEQEMEEEERLIDCLTHEDLFALCIAAVGHDVGHPGLTNAFMKNAKTPLAVLYDDKSVLEQMHYSLILRIMRHNGLEHLLFPRVRDRDKAKDKDEDPKSTNNAPQNRPDSSRNETQADYATQQKEKLRQEVPRHQGGSNVFRKLLLMTVLATDLSVHGEFMRRYDRMLVERNEPSGESAVAEGPGPGGGKPGPEDELFERKMLLCQALIKCADISNPCRPYSVSQHWAAALESEWSSQLLLEKHLHLPTTVKPSDNSLAEANTQVFFISTFAKPLFELTARGIPQMEPFAAQCRDNLHLWAERKEVLTAAQDLLAISPTSNTEANPALVELQASSSSVPPSCLHSIPARTPEDFLSAFPPTLPKSFLSPEIKVQVQVTFEIKVKVEFDGVDGVRFRRVECI